MLVYHNRKLFFNLINSNKKLLAQRLKITKQNKLIDYETIINELDHYYLFVAGNGTKRR